MTGAGAIRVVRARTHNLKNVSCSIPIGALTVVTGPSGSGKSSLAFDTLYAEGQRRFVESMSTYARQYLERLERPDVDAIEHVLPAVAIEQRAPARSARSTVGTATEIHDVLRLLFAAIGTLRCPDDGRPVRRDTPETVREELRAAFGDGARVLVVALRAVRSFEVESAVWRRAGFFRFVGREGDVLEVSSTGKSPVDSRGRVALLIGRHVLSPDDPEILSSLSMAFDHGDGELLVLKYGEPLSEARKFFRGLVCHACGRAFSDPVPALFSFNSPRGACVACQGFGRLAGIDPKKVVPDPSKSLEERPFAPFNSPAYESAYADLKRACRRHGVRRDVPWSRMTARERRIVWDGEGEWYGVKGLFAWLERKRYKVHVRVFLSRYRGYTTCPDCGGTRLKPEALAVTLRDRTIAVLGELTLAELLTFFAEACWSPAEKERSGPLVPDLVQRVGTLVELGLPYLTLSRQVRTLSGGEAQRLQLGAAIGNSLTGTLYVLDEPTVGLHPQDTNRLLGALERLARRGNAVVAVEHDLAVIRAADRVLDLGPAAGAAGGQLVFEGTPAELERADTRTGRALREERACEETCAPVRPLRVTERPEDAPSIRVVGARAHNLRDLTVSIPLGKLVGICGVSGSGKSSLAVDVLAAGARQRMGNGLISGLDDVGEHDALEGLDALTDVVLVDQSPLGRSSRSNPATTTKAWDVIRAHFARTAAARRAGLGPAAFSFNARGGRCETCQGSGVVTVDMQFLADVSVVCDECDGRRFKRKVLAVRLRGKNVDELLATTVDEARLVFSDVVLLVERLAPLQDAGLGYLTLGQATATLSGGEAQRLKVAAWLRKGALTGRVLFVFDEPTTGLHPSDVAVLLGVFRRLLAAGHSVVAVEHHPGFLRACDHLLELGPGGGPAGGRVIYEGTPEVLCRSGSTPTAAALCSTLQSGAT